MRRGSAANPALVFLEHFVESVVQFRFDRPAAKECRGRRPRSGWPFRIVSLYYIASHLYMKQYW
jgi:hypothetical protein